MSAVEHGFEAGRMGWDGCSLDLCWRPVSTSGTHLGICCGSLDGGRRWGRGRLRSARTRTLRLGGPRLCSQSGMVAGLEPDGGYVAIEGTAKRLYRKDITARIADALSVEAPKVPRGSTVGTDFLDSVVKALGGDPASLASTYRKIEFALNMSNEVYNPNHDSSEHLGRMGGGTVTNGGYRKLLRGITGKPQCFILNIADHPVSAQYADVPGESYGFDDDVSGRIPFLEAGPGSRVVFYRTSKATELPKQVFIAHAIVSDVGRADGEGYRASLVGYQELDSPVSVGEVEITNWNNQHGIAEIDYLTLARLVEVGRGVAAPEDIGKGNRLEDPAQPPIESPVPSNITDEGEANRILKALDPVDAPLDLTDLADEWPDILPGPAGEPAPEQVVSLGEDAEGEVGITTSGRRGRGAAGRALDRYAERRAVYLAKKFLAEQGWHLHRDCQSLGVGYDLDYRRDTTQLHVEVKGIQGASLTFSLTALEWARALDDPDFVVIAVTGVLFPHTTRIHVVTRDRLAAAVRRPVQYRVTVT
jgi:hypothetical protein